MGALGRPCWPSRRVLSAFSGSGAQGVQRDRWAREPPPAVEPLNPLMRRRPLTACCRHGGVLVPPPCAAAALLSGFSAFQRVQRFLHLGRLPADRRGERRGQGTQRRCAPATRAGSGQAVGSGKFANHRIGNACCRPRFALRRNQGCRARRPGSADDAEVPRRVAGRSQQPLGAGWRGAPGTRRTRLSRSSWRPGI